MAANMRLAPYGKTNLMESHDIHIHFPTSAVPKDKSSAGAAIAIALVSLFSRKRVRVDSAIAGEMTLRGVVLPIGGIMDKFKCFSSQQILAAHRYGIRQVILPVGNSKDLVEVPSDVLASLEIILVKEMEEILEEALDGGCPWRQY